MSLHHHPRCTIIVVASSSSSCRCTIIVVASSSPLHHHRRCITWSSVGSLVVHRIIIGIVNRVINILAPHQHAAHHSHSPSPSDRTSDWQLLFLLLPIRTSGIIADTSINGICVRAAAFTIKYCEKNNDGKPLLIESAWGYSTQRNRQQIASASRSSWWHRFARPYVKRLA